MRTLLLAALAAAPFVADQARAECHVPRFSFSPKAQVNATMEASSGQSCTVKLSASEQSRFDKVAIVAPARHGTAAAAGVGGVAYTSAAGYAGDDSFVFSVTGQMKSGYGTARIRIRVSVLGEGATRSSAAASAPPSTTMAARRHARTAAAASRGTVDLVTARRECTRRHAGHYDPQTRITWYDKRYSSVYFECLARRTGASLQKQ